LKRLATKVSLSALLVYMVLLSMSSFILAESEPGNAIPEPQMPQVGALDSLQMIGKVIMFLILIIALFFVLVRFLNRKNKFSIFGRSVRSLGGVPLGQNKSIQIVEIGHSLYVVGVGDNIQLLEKINDPEEVEYVSQLLQTNQGEYPSFQSFGKWLGKLQSRKKDVVEEDVEITSSFQQVFHDKLQRVTSRNKNVEEWLSEQKQSDRLNDK
jgi:flagellar protein FliO/FliZ